MLLKLRPIFCPVPIKVVALFYKVYVDFFIVESILCICEIGVHDYLVEKNKKFRDNITQKI